MAGAAQVARHELGGAAQVLHQPGLDLHAPRCCLIRRDDAAGGGDDDQADSRPDEQLDQRETAFLTACHHRLQHARLTSASLAVVASLPEA